MELLIKNIGVISTAVGYEPKSGTGQSEVIHHKDFVIGIDKDKIVFVGKEEDAPQAEKIIDAKGRLVTAGLIDAHTHLIFGGWRQNELDMKLKGVPYLDILSAGGGILSTVRATRNTSKEELKKKAQVHLSVMLSHGTTTCEAKSGYGLDMETEIKQLEAADELNHEQAVSIVSTFMGAHAIPSEYKENRDAYIALLREKILPEIAKRKLAEFCDIFCETAVFTVGESRKILESAKKLGFSAKIHADEIAPTGGAELAAEINAISAEHLIQASDTGIKKMAESNAIAVLLPATSFYLNKPFARAREMIDAGVPVALATDFNPGSSPNCNLQLAMQIGCYKYVMTPEEVLTAVTLNAAAAVSRGSELGTVEVGKKADLIIWDAEDLPMIFYRYGTNQVDTVIKNGKVVIGGYNVS